MTEVLDRAGVQVHSVAVPHGMMPAVAYRVTTGSVPVVFSGDVQDFHPPPVELASGCDVFVCEMALPERDVPHGHLHAKPSAVGRMARESGPRKLVLTHFMPEIEDEIPAAMAEVRRHYTGDLVLADDLLRLMVRA